MRAGDRLGRYGLVQVLGSGGMGEVWEAVLHGPHGFRKTVALKLLRQGPQDARARDALLKEARLGASLQHPNVVGTWALGEEDDTWCIAMELVRGASTWQLVQDAPLPPRALLEVATQTCAGLAHIHPRLVHRDIKPSNLLVDRSGLVKIADLGIATPGGDAPAGTRGYMAPEQADGRAEPRSDLFGLGATLYVLATGRRPPDTLAKTEALDAVLPGLGAVLKRCLRRDPGDRWATAGELAAALTDLGPAEGPGLMDVLARVCPDVRPDEGISTPPVRAASSTPTVPLVAGNLPRPRDRFLGRRHEVEQVAALLRSGSGRPVVLLGTGGMGKTRLALEAARWIGGELQGGCWFLDLTDARSLEGICLMAARALGVDLGGSDPVAQIGDAMAARGRALFVLDNLEQCIEPLPDTLGRWLQAAPDGVFLGTSRIAPRLRGEQTVPIGPLPTADAAALFLDRSAAPVPERDLADVHALVSELEGMPLAVELAAARTRMLPVPTIRARLGLQLLSGGPRELPERHRSLEASLAWSWDLLSPQGRAALAQLSVTEGSFDLPIAEAVIEGDRWALDVLQELVDASLVRVHPATSRFSLLVVVAAWASAQLDPADRAAAEVRHGEHLASRFGALAGLRSAVGPDLYRDLADNIENLVAASRRAVVRGDAGVATATALAAWHSLDVTGPPALAVDLLAAAEAVEGIAVDVHAELLRVLGSAYLSLGRPARARDSLDRALELHRGAGHGDESAEILGELAQLASREGRLDEAVALQERALAIHRASGDTTRVSVVLCNLATALYHSGRLDEARERDLEAWPLLQQLSDLRGEGAMLGNLGLIELELGRPDEARRIFERALDVNQRIGNIRSQGSNLGNLGLLHHVLGEVDAARASFEAALQIHRTTGSQRSEAITLGNLGDLCRDGGDLDAAVPLYAEARAIHLERQDRLWAAIEGGRLARALVQRRDPAALPLLEEVVDTLSGHMAPAAALFLACLGEARSQAGDVEGARRDLDEALDTILACGQDHEQVGVLCCRARALRDPGSLAKALRIAETSHAAPGSALRAELDRTERYLRSSGTA